MQLALLPLSALVGFDAYTSLAEPHPRALWLRILMMQPLALEALVLLAAYIAYVYWERGRGWRALCRSRPGLANEDAFGLVLFLVALGPWSIFAIYTPTVWDGHIQGLPTRIVVQGGLLLMPLVVYPFLYAFIRIAGWEWGDEDDGGGGGPDDPSGPDGPDPSWWADFERQFRSYSRSSPREPAGVA